jgi:hypothetical protein
MRNRLASVTLCAGLVTAGLVGGIEQTQGQAAPAAQPPAPPAPADTAALRAQYEKWRTEFKTWGRWAPLGQESKGTTNFITPEKVAGAMKLVKDGIVVSLAHAEPQTAAADVGPPGVFHRVTNAITDVGTTDNYQVSYHGQTVAHIDTWCHFFENGQMYNGVPVKDNVTSESGCIKGSVMNWKGGITTDHASGSRSVGEKIRREDRPRGHPAAVHRPMEATRGARSMDGPGGGLLPRYDSVDA